MTDAELVRSAGPISVVIPAFNEAARLPGTLDQIVAFLRGCEGEFEVLVVDDGSADGTASAVGRRGHAGVRVLRLDRNQGKGAAVKAGMLAAAGRMLLFADADNSTPIENLPRLLWPMEKDGCDIAIASRAVRGSVVIQGQGWLRQKMGETFSALAKLLLVHGYGDSQCGFKCFQRAAAMSIFPRLTSASVLFDLEILVLAGREGLRFAEVPVAWRHDPDSRLVYDARKSLAIFAELLRLRRRWGVRLPVKIDARLYPPADASWAGGR